MFFDLQATKEEFFNSKVSDCKKIWQKTFLRQINITVFDANTVLRNVEIGKKNHLPFGCSWQILQEALNSMSATSTVNLVMKFIESG